MAALRRELGRQGSSIAILLDWREGHERAHAHAEARQARMPGTVFTAITVGLGIATLLLSLYFAGVRP